jgi:hypothetical protein
MTGYSVSLSEAKNLTQYELEILQSLRSFRMSMSR